MSQSQAALEHLRIIRSLMERAHIYRSISAPAALFGGVLALTVTAWPVWHAVQTNGEAAFSNRSFLLIWHGILLITTVLNMSLLARDAARREQPFISEGMRTALKAFLPPLLVGGVVALSLVIYLHNLTMAAFMWVLCYGLGLLATSGFSPRSLKRLGWSFVLTGLLLFIAWTANGEVRNLKSDLGPASLVLGLTFGLLHVCYAIAVFIRTRPIAEVEAE